MSEAHRPEDFPTDPHPTCSYNEYQATTNKKHPNKEQHAETTDSFGSLHNSPWGVRMMRQSKEREREENERIRIKKLKRAERRHLDVPDTVLDPESVQDHSSGETALRKLIEEDVKPFAFAGRKGDLEQCIAAMAMSIHELQTWMKELIRKQEQDIKRAGRATRIPASHNNEENEHANTSFEANDSDTGDSDTDSDDAGDAPPEHKPKVLSASEIREAHEEFCRGRRPERWVGPANPSGIRVPSTEYDSA